MTRQGTSSLHYYDQAVTDMIMSKYGLERMDALRAFVESETHALLEDTAYGLYRFGAAGIFDMWECEKVTGDPRNSVYARGE